MAKGIKICKVCGQEYEACHTLRPNLDSIFYWQDVACCPEHGAIYLARILESRGMAVGDVQTTPDVEQFMQDKKQADDVKPKKRSSKKRPETDEVIEE